MSVEFQFYKIKKKLRGLPSRCRALAPSLAIQGEMQRWGTGTTHNLLDSGEI